MKHFGIPCLMDVFGEPVTLTWTSCWRPENLHFNDAQKYRNLSAAKQDRAVVSFFNALSK